MSAAVAIRVAGVSKAFGRRRVLSGVDLEVPKGERLALVGPNGAGKTTLIRCLLGEYRCDGEVAVDERSPRAERALVLRKVGFVPQIPPPLKMPVAQLVRFAADLCDADCEAIQQDAGRLGLDAHEVRRQPFFKLSGGQKQKLLIAIALRPGADLLIMDEPAANLDPEARHTFLELLAERDGRATMLISSHRLDEVAALVSRVVELDGGRISLDERVAGSGRLDARLRCRVSLARSDAGAAAALGAWGLRPAGDASIFVGTIAGADRLRFLGMLARYSGLLRAVQLEETSEVSVDPCDV